MRDITNTYCWGKINFDVTEWGYVVNTPYIHYSLQSGWFSKVLTLQTEERLTVGLDPSVHSAVSVLLLNCLFLSYSFNYGEQEVKESRPPRPYTHTPYLLQRTPILPCIDTHTNTQSFHQSPAKYITKDRQGQTETSCPFNQKKKKKKLFFKCINVLYLYKLLFIGLGFWLSENNGMISKGPYDTENWRNGSFTITGINYILKYIQTDIPQYYCYYFIFY